MTPEDAVKQFQQVEEELRQVAEAGKRLDTTQEALERAREELGRTRTQMGEATAALNRAGDEILHAAEEVTAAAETLQQAGAGLLRLTQQLGNLDPQHILDELVRNREESRKGQQVVLAVTGTALLLVLLVALGILPL